jgi:mono/diheme cytochrome c family protein
MKQRAMLAILAVTPLLTAALWMDDQPSFKPYKPPVLAPPAGSVPVSGRETAPAGGGVSNPVKPTPASRAEGNALFDINCVICHGRISTEPGPVGKKIKPPPPGLSQDLVQALPDAVIYKVISNGFGRMPAFRSKLAPSERWNLVNYLRTRK